VSQKEGIKAVKDVCDCEHHTHDPTGRGTAAEHEFGAVAAIATIRSPWGATFRVCQVCLDAGHMQGTQFR